MNEIEQSKNSYQIVATNSSGKVVHESVVAAERMLKVKKLYLEEGFSVQVTELKISPKEEG